VYGFLYLRGGGGGREAKAVVAEIFHADLLVGTFLITYTQILNFLFRKKALKIHLQVKSKAVPLQAWTGPEGSRKLRFPDFKTIGT